MLHYRLTVSKDNGNQDCVITDNKMDIRKYPYNKDITSWRLEIFWDRFKYNDVEFPTKVELLDALKVLTEPELIEFVKEGNFAK
jgi:hypothetical protein